jgi:hypothetical protein
LIHRLSCNVFRPHSYLSNKVPYPNRLAGNQQACRSYPYTIDYRRIASNARPIRAATTTSRISSSRLDVTCIWNNTNSPARTAPRFSCTTRSNRQVRWRPCVAWSIEPFDNSSAQLEGPRVDRTRSSASACSCALIALWWNRHIAMRFSVTATIVVMIETNMMRLWSWR